MDHPWPLSAGMPGAGLPSPMEVHHHGPPRQHRALLTPQSSGADPRVLFATRFWGRRRFSDSFSQLPHTLTAQALRELNCRSCDGNSPPDMPIYPPPDLPPTPTSARSFPPAPPHYPTPPLAPQHHVHVHHHFHHYQHSRSSAAPSWTSLPALLTASAPAPPPTQAPPQTQSRPGFLHIPGYVPRTIHPRNPLPLASRREELVEALSKIEARAGPVTLKGVGHLARPLVANKGRESPGRVLSCFLEEHERTLLVPAPIADNGGVIKKRQENETRLRQRELGMLESELFDVGKFLTAGEGGVGGRYLTVLSWSEDSSYGTVTLFEVEVEAPPPLRRTAKVTGLSARRRLVPAPLCLSGSREKVVGVRPVAAMEDVPRQVLVGMRVDQDVKKAVLQHDRRSGRFRWAAQHTRQGPPSYARLAGMDNFCEIRTASGTGFNDDCRGRRSRPKGARRRERSSLRVEDARHIIPHREVHDDSIFQDAYGVVATIPQFLALLHASHSIIEKASSTPVTITPLTAEDGERVRVVTLCGAVKGTRHRDRGVHVVVLLPDGAKWAEERIFWTDDQGGLAELRQKKYREVIDSGKTAARRGMGTWDTRSLGPLSSPLTRRSARW